MKKYIAPEMEVSKFEVSDVITLSVAANTPAYTSDTNGDLQFTSDYTNG